MLKISGVPISVHTRKVIVAAVAKGIAHEVVPVVPVVAADCPGSPAPPAPPALAKGLPHEVVPVVPVIPGNPPPNWRELSPTGLIPALTDGDFTVADSAAICGYLERAYPDKPLYPRAARDYANALSLEQYAGKLFSDVVRPLFHEVFVHPKVRNVPTDHSKIDDVLTYAVPEAFGYLDRVAGQDFLAGKALSMADIAVASNLVTYQYIGFDLY